MRSEDAALHLRLYIRMTEITYVIHTVGRGSRSGEHEREGGREVCSLSIRQVDGLGIDVSCLYAV